MKDRKRYLNCKYLDAGMDGMLCSLSLCTTCKEFNGEKCYRYTAKNEMKEFETVTMTTEQLLEQHICEICKSRKDCNNNICSMCQIVVKGLVKKGWKFIEK